MSNKRFVLRPEERELIEGIRRNGVSINHRTGTAYVVTDEVVISAEMITAAKNSRAETEVGVYKTLGEIIGSREVDLIVEAAIRAALVARAMNKER